MNKIDEFLSNYEKKNTIKCHRLNLKYYFKFVGIEPEKYFTKKRDYSPNFIDYSQSLRHLSPCTRSSRLATVKLFLEENDVVIPKKTLNKTTARLRNKPQTMDEIPQPKELKEILSHGNTKDRAMFLFSSSSGCRINEVLSLEKTDIPNFKRLEQNKPAGFPVKVNIRGEISKNGEPRITFISTEAWESLLEWMKERDAYLKQAIGKTNKEYKKSENDDRLFPHGYTTAFKSWHRCLKKAGYHDLDPTTGIVKMHIHVLRAYFKNRMLSAGIQERIIEILLGHIGYVGGAYDKFSIDELTAAYTKAENHLCIFSTQSKDVTDLNEKMQEKDKQIEKMQQHISDIDQQLRKLLINKLIEDDKKR
jgi:integrase